MPQQIARYLKLPNPESFTGHSFRRSAATLIADYGANITTLKRLGGWRSTSVAEGYIEESVQNKAKISNIIQSAIPLPSSSTSYVQPQKLEILEDIVLNENVPTTENMNQQSNFVTGRHIEECANDSTRDKIQSTAHLPSTSYEECIYTVNEKSPKLQEPSDIHTNNSKISPSECMNSTGGLTISNCQNCVIKITHYAK